MLFHLFPKKFACIRRICIVERTDITRSYPVFNAVFDGLLVHPPFSIKLFEVIGIVVELRPNGNHDTGIQSVNRIHHSFRVRETGFVKLMTSPFGFRPVVPVENDIVNRNLTLTKLFQCTYNFILRFVTFTTLPETHGPFRHNGCFAGNLTIAAYYFVGIITTNEIVIHLLTHFRPERQLGLFFFRHRT